MIVRPAMLRRLARRSMGYGGARARLRIPLQRAIFDPLGARATRRVFTGTGIVRGRRSLRAF